MIVSLSIFNLPNRLLVKHFRAAATALGALSISDQLVALVEYVTATVSPAVVTLATLKLPSEYRVPAVELWVFTAPVPVTKKHP
jgi:hypothetical protein